jgi:hypothetical protein
MDIWIAMSELNAENIAQTLHDFGIPDGNGTRHLFTEKDKVIRMGVPPVRIKVITTATGVDFFSCYSHRVTIDDDGIPVNLISLDDLLRNKKACGRYKDLEDLQRLP